MTDTIPSPMAPFLSLRSPVSMLESGEGLYLAYEILCYVLCLLAFWHAKRSSRLEWFYCIFVYSITTEMISYYVPHIDSFWHSQSMVQFLYGKLPLYMIAMYLWMNYVAVTTAEKLFPNENVLVRAMAAGLSAVILDPPVDMVGAKFLFWIWHDSDPNTLDKSFYVPWTSYMFYVAFPFTLVLLFNGFKSVFRAPPSSSSPLTILAATAAGMLTFPVSVIQFMIFYHPLHDFLGVHTKYCFFLQALLFLAVFFRRYRGAIPASSQALPSFEIKVIVLINVLFFVTLAIIQPNAISVNSFSFRQPIAPPAFCTQTSPILTPFGTLYKFSNACISPTRDFSEDGALRNSAQEVPWDLHCLSKEEMKKLENGKGENGQNFLGHRWYRVCGREEPMTEFWLTVLLACGLEIAFFMTVWPEKKKLD